MRSLVTLCADLDCEDLRASWSWLVPWDASPLMIGIFGDWIFAMPDGSHWHLDLLEGQFRQAAQNAPEFEAKLKDAAFQVEWFSADWAEIAQGHGLHPARDECLGWAVHPIFGAPFSIENIRIFRMTVYQAVLGQLFQQLAQGRFGQPD